MASTADADFQFRGIERRVLDLLAVPSAPEPPEGSPNSIRVFRAGEKYYIWSLLVWVARCIVFGAVVATWSVALAVNVSKLPALLQIALTLLVILAWIVYAAALVVTFIARRLNYRLRWYIVTDRSLRIRSGVFRVNELTMTYGNIQEIRVTAGPLQHLLGLADVEVQAAGGGGGDKHKSGGHIGRFEGLSNANAIRDLLAERVRQYRDSGLGDTPHHTASSADDSLTAAKEMLEEVRALRGVLAAQ
jgi:uncharacterized membrane protein YdbT with pleckstrin-like domain